PPPIGARPGSRPRARAAGDPSSGGTGTGRLPDTRPPVPDSRTSAPRSPARQPTRGEGRRAPARYRLSPTRPRGRLPPRASNRGQRSLRRADVLRGWPEEPAGPLLLEDVRRPAGDARA